MSRTSRSKAGGFTIIEVMIVLAIAGLIMLIVFLAVPAIQRASRNYGRKQDVGRLYAALDTYLTDNPQLTLSAGPNQILLSTGKIVGDQGEAGHLAIINNKCDPSKGSELNGDYGEAGDVIGNRSEECADDDADGQGVYMFREVQTGFHNFLGPYLNSTSAFGPNTVHIMIGAKCDTPQTGMPTGSNYAYFEEEDDPHIVAIAYALETTGLPQAYCKDFSLQ